jgi:urease accessory protein
LAVLSSVLTDDKTMAAFAEQIDAGRSDGNLAVVEGALSFALDIGVEEAVLLELRGTAVALLSAALRLGRISATRAQALAASLVPTLDRALDIALVLPIEEMRAVAPELEVAAMSHDRRDARLFAS